MELPPVIAVTVTGDVAFLDTELLHFPLGTDPEQAALDEVTKRYAAPAGKPIRVVAVDDNATVTLLVHPDGHTSDVRPLRMDDPLIDAYADRAGGLRLPEEPDESTLAKLGDIGAKFTDPAKSAAAGVAASAARMRERSRTKADVRATDRANRAAAKAAKVRQRAEEKQAAQAALARTTIADEPAPEKAAPKSASKAAPKKPAAEKVIPPAPAAAPKPAFRKAAVEKPAPAASEPGARVSPERTPRSTGGLLGKTVEASVRGSRRAADGLAQQTPRPAPTRAHAKPTPGLAERATHVSKAAAAGLTAKAAQAGASTRAASAGIGAKAGAVGGKTKLAAAGVVSKASTAGDKTRVAAAGFGTVATEVSGKTRVAAAALTGKAAQAIGSPQARTAAVAIIATAALVVFAAFGITLFSGNGGQTDNSAGDSISTAIVPETPGSEEATTKGAAAQPTVPAPTFADAQLLQVGAFAFPRDPAVVAFTFKAPQTMRAKLTLDPQTEGKPTISRTVELGDGETKYLVRDVPSGKVRWELEATNVLPLSGVVDVEEPPAPPPSDSATDSGTDPDSGSTPDDPDPDPTQPASTPPPGGPVDPDDPSGSPGGPVDPDMPS